MSLTKVAYTRDWNNPSDFPTIETSEAIVRSDMQDLWDQTKSDVNAMIDELEGTTGASNIGITPITGVTGTKVQGALEDLKDQVDTKASSTDFTTHTSNTSNPHSVTKAQVGLGNVDNTSDANKPISTATATALATKESISDANNLIQSVTFTEGTGTFVFTKQGGGTITIDTNLEKVPGTMALIEDPIGSGTYYLVIYDRSTPPQELSRCPVTALFNAIEVENTATINLTLATSTAGKKKLTANVIDGSVTFAKLASAVQDRITALETAAITGVTDTSTIDLEISNHNLTASVKDGSITSAKLEAGLYDEIEGFKDDAETAATNAAASESNASDYATAASGSATTASGHADTASGYATAAGNSATAASGSATSANASALAASGSAGTASTQATYAQQRATLAQSWAVGGTGTRTGEDTNNSKYWAEQAAEAASGGNTMQKIDYDPGLVVLNAGGIPAYVDEYIPENWLIPDESMMPTSEVSIYTKITDYDSTLAVKNAGGIPAYVEANGGKIDHIKVNSVEQPIVNKTVDIAVPSSVVISPTTPTGDATVWVDTSATGSTIDSAPTSGSFNAVSSNGVYQAIQNIPTPSPLLAYPVGSVYFSVDNVNPATVLGGGTWVQIGTKIVMNDTIGGTYTFGGSATADVYGSGYALSLSDGTNLSGLYTGGDWQNFRQSSAYFGKAIGSSVQASSPYTSNVTGVATKSQLGEHPEYSGLTAEVSDFSNVTLSGGTLTAETVYSWKRTA